MPWVKGQSGNPGGRPKALKAVEEAARQHTPLAIETLAAICADAEQPGAARVTAAVALLNRGWGMPKQAHDHTIRTPAAAADDAALLAIALAGGGAGDASEADPPQPGGVVH